MLQFDEGFQTSLSRLTERERKDALLVAFEVQQDRRRAGLHIEPLRHAASGDLWSVRVNDDLRIILLRNDEAYIPLFVGHHEKAYRWAEARRTIRDPKSGSITIVHDIASSSRSFIYDAPPKGRFDNYDDAYLLSLGLPDTLLPAIRHVRTDDDVLNLTEGLPRPVADRLLHLADGRLVPPPLPAAPDGEAPEYSTELSDVTVTPPESAAAESVPLRLIQVADDDLRRMLDAPMELWMAFLHPSQRGVATRTFGGPARISGGAGTGKTVVAMHRARHLARQGMRVLLASFTNNARAILERGIGLICTPDERNRITVRTVHAQARQIVTELYVVRPPAENQIEALIRDLAPGTGFDAALLESEWRQVIQALGITRWEEYRDARRTGRGTRLSIAERERIWDRVIVPLDETLKAEDIRDWPDICNWARDLLAQGLVASPFDAVIVDETQDLGPQELRFLAALAGDGPDCLTLVGDAGQRIYPNRITLRELGIDVRGRTRVLTLNYRTTAEIYRFAEAILGNDIDDLDGGKERRKATYSLMHGPEPEMREFATSMAQYAFVAECIAERCANGSAPGTIAVLARSRNILTAIETALDEIGVPARLLTRDHALVVDSHVTLATIHRAKGLEFPRVFLIGASDDAIIRHLPDDAEEQELTLEQERNVLYVAATRARDELVVTWVGRPNRFLPATATCAAGSKADRDGGNHGARISG